MLAFYITLSLLVSFTCSLLEAAILSVTPTYLNVLKGKNPKLYDKISFLEDDIEKPLASILTLNTIAHTIGAAGAGAEAQKIWGNEYLSLFSAVLTFVILFFSEIIPKSIGARSWKRLLPVSTLLLKPMIAVSYPIVWISLKISKIIKGDQKDVVNRDEIPAMAELSLASGEIEQSEYLRLKSLLEFNEWTLKDLITPYSKVAGVKSEFTIEEAYESIKKNTYSRLIVYGVHDNDIKGYVMRKDILQALVEKEANTTKKIKDITRKILIIPQTTSGQKLFDRLLERKAHMGAVIDSNGDFMGIITLEDLIEALMGTEIYDEFDS